jgi:branched-chain amino acid transport system substrate-binding protein
MRKIIFILVSVLVMISSCQKNSDEIVIGGAISLTGDNSMQGHRALNGILLAIDYVNENGGINGKKLKFVTEDTQTSAKGAINAYTKLVQMNDVDAIISTGDVEFQAINDITNKSKKVTVATVCSGMLENNRSPYLFRYCFNEKIQDAILMKYVKDSLLVNDLSLLYPNNLWGKEIEQYNELAAKNASIQISQKETYDPNSLDQKAVALKLMQKNPKIICARGFGSGFEAVLKHLSELGYKGTIIGDITISLPSTINNTKGAVEGAYYVSVDLKNSNDEFTNLYKQKYHEKYDEEASVWDALGFDSCLYIAKALQYSEDNGISLQEALKKVNNVKLLLGDNKFMNSNDVEFEMFIFKL